MLTLKQHLTALRAHDLRGIATRLAVRQRHQQGKDEWIAAIVQAWQILAHEQNWVAQLSAAAQAGLRHLCQVERIPAVLFLAEYGAVRPAIHRQGAIHPRGLVPPWQAPQTAAEELYYIGLLLPTAGQPLTKADYVTLPSDLRPLLCAAFTPEVIPGRLNTALSSNRGQTAAWLFCHDIGQLLIYLYQQTVRFGYPSDRPTVLQHGRWLTPTHLRLLNQRLLVPAPEPLPPSHKQTTRLCLLMFLATTAGLLHAGMLTPLAWAWLEESPAQQLALLWRGWQTASADLRRTYAQPDANLPDPWPAPLLAALAAQPATFTVAMIMRHLFTAELAPPTYWVAHLTNLSELEQLLAALLQDVLVALGAVEIVSQAPFCCQLTRVGQWLLASHPQSSPVQSIDTLPAPTSATLVVQVDEWRLSIPATALLAQAQLAPYTSYGAQICQPAPVHLYTLDANTIRRAAAKGLGLPNLLAALTSLGITLTRPDWQQLHAWYQAGRALELGSYPLLRTTTAMQMQALHQAPTVHPLLGELLSPTTVLLNTDVAEMMQALHAVGCYATTSQPTPDSDVALTAETGALWLAGQIYADVGQQLALPLPPPFATLQQLFNGLPAAQQALLQSQLTQFRAALLDLLDQRTFTPPPHPSDPNQWQPQLEALIATKGLVQMDYFSAGRNLLTRRQVEPYWLETQTGTPYLRAYCHQAGCVLTFRLDRIQGLEAVDNRR